VVPEATAYLRLQQRLMKAAQLGIVTITGPLLKNENGFFMEVRTFAA
jgi:hypothetical protein